MRLRNWIAVLVSVVLLMAMGTIGILVNRSALRAADNVHRADTRALAVNNATLAGQMQMLTAAELNEFTGDHTLNLGKGDRWPPRPRRPRPRCWPCRAPRWCRTATSWC